MGHENTLTLGYLESTPKLIVEYVSPTSVLVKVLLLWGDTMTVTTLIMTKVYTGAKTV